MELKEFVAETLRQIVEGVISAHEDIKDKNASVNPWLSSAPVNTFVRTGGGNLRTISMIDFEVSLTETEGKETGGRIGVFFGSVGVGGQAKADAGSSAINKVKFSIPILLPAHYPG